MVHGWMPLLFAVSGTSNGLVDVFGGLASFLLSLTIIVIAVGVIFLVVMFIWRIWKLGRASHLVMGLLSNATGNSDLDKVLPCFNQVVRETLATNWQAMRERIDQIRPDQGDGDEVAWKAQEIQALLPRSDSHYPVPEGTTAAKINHLLISFRDGNSGRAWISERLVSLLAAPRDTRIVIMLQRRNGALSGTQVGVSVEVLDVEGRHAPVLRTFWDSAGPNTDGHQPQPLTTAVLSAAEPPANTTAAANGSSGKRTSTVSKTAAAKLAQLQVAQALDESRQQEERYRELLRCVALWLAGEMASSALLMDEERVAYPLRLLFERRRGRTDKPSIGQEAVIHNFIGYFHLTAALICDGFSDFYRLAVREFQQAIAVDRQWYQPHENLADTYVMWAQAMMTQKQVGQAGSVTLQLPAGTVAKRYLYEALIGYDEAMRLFDQHGHTPLAAQTEKYGCEGDGKTVERSIQLGKSTALLMIGDDENMKRAMRGVKFLRGDQWDLEAEKDGFLLYALARWYALANMWQFELPEGLTTPDASARQAACRYLAYSLARERRLWACAAADPCFAGLFSTAAAGCNREKLLLALTRKSYETRATSQGAKELSTLTGREFEEIIIAALQESVE